MKTERTQLIENMILSEIDFFKHKDQLKTETDPKKIAILQSCIENDTIILDTWIENYDIIADDILPSRTQVLLNAKDSIKNSYQKRINFLIEEVHNLHAENTENNTERY